MRPDNLTTKLFLDSGDPERTHEFEDPCGDTKEALEACGVLDGQTTNPSLVAKNPDAKARIETGEKFTRDELFGFYKGIVQEISELIPDGSVSVEVYADTNSTAEDMMEQAREMNTWIPNAHIKLPIIPAGLEAARQALDEGMRVNMTLCFTQEQAVAVYDATRGAQRGDVFVSPFVGRLDDRGENGMDLITNILKVYEQGDGHVEVLAASIRSVEHFKAAIHYRSDIITAPYDVLKEWVDAGTSVPDDDFHYDTEGRDAIAYKEVDLNTSWNDLDITHPLTDSGLQKFADDWNALVKEG